MSSYVSSSRGVQGVREKDEKLFLTYLTRRRKGDRRIESPPLERWGDRLSDYRRQRWEGKGRWRGGGTGCLTTVVSGGFVEIIKTVSGGERYFYNGR